MRLTVVRMVGDVAYGWDGYGNWVDGVVIGPAAASKVRQALCYTKSVVVTQR